MKTPTIRLTRVVHEPDAAKLARARLLITATFVASAVTILLLAPDAHAQAFRAGDQVFLPAIGSVTNANGIFASDVALSNLTADDIAVSVTFTQVNTGNPVPQRFPGVVHLKARQRLEFSDFTRSTLHVDGVGMAVFNGCKEGANCAADAAGYRGISVESRIYSSAFANGPTVGQDLPGIPWRQTATSDVACCAGLQTLQIVGIRASTQWRTNIGLVNASEFSSCYLVVSLYDGTDGGLRDQVPVRLGPLENLQQSVVAMFPKLADWSRLNRGRSVTNAVVTITQGGITPTADAVANGCPAGCPAFLAYGSMLDNQTNDATTLEAQYVYELAPATLGAPTPSIFATLRASALSTMSAGDELRRRDRMSYEAGLSLHRDMQVQLPADCNLTVACLANLIAMRQAGITPPSASR